MSWQSGYGETANAAIRVRHAELEVVKWIAILTMTIDHYGKIIDPSLYTETNAIGRLTYPLFAWIIGTRLAQDPHLTRRYLENLLPWALISQPVYMWVGKDWTDPNIFITLLLGVGIHGALLHYKLGQRLRGVLLIALLLPLSTLVDYGLIGACMIPIIALASTKNIIWAALLTGPLGVLSNLLLTPPYIGPGAIWALLSSALAGGLLASRFLMGDLKMPRLPKQLFYAYYPAHLIVLHLLR